MICLTWQIFKPYDRHISFNSKSRSHHNGSYRKITSSLDLGRVKIDIVANFQMLVEVFSQDKKFSANLFENKNLRTPGNTSDLFQKLFQPSRH
jgi:hypothetical protein